MTGRRTAARSALATALASLALLPSAASAHAPGVILKAFGTATIDGAISPGEWDQAARIDFAATLPAAEGGGTTPTSLLVMTNGSNLYIAVRVARAALGADAISLSFDNDHDSVWPEDGDDGLALSPALPGGFWDTVRAARPPCPAGQLCGFRDGELGGSSDGAGAFGNTGGFSVYEASHPLDSSDDLNDFSLGAGNTVGFVLGLSLCSGPCELTTVPANGALGGPLGDIVVVVVPDTTPPESQLTGGPENGSFTSATEATFAFTGGDDVSEASSLLFECSLDGSPFSPCSSPSGYTSLSEGAHTIAVRARDRAGNEDPTPATRSWTVDTTAPDTTITGAPAELTLARSATFEFTGQDALAAAGELAFQCSVDDRAAVVCTNPHALAGLGDGRHTFTVRAIDRAGNVDSSPAEHAWTVDATRPRKPTIRGPRRIAGTRPSFRLSSSDALTPPSKLRFLCAVDARPLRSCASPYRPALTPGKHVLRVAAKDLAGNRSPVARFRVIRNGR